MERAQAQLDQVTEGLARFDELLGWLSAADARVRALDDYVRGQGQVDVETALAADPEGITPPVVNEDAVYEALVDFDERMQRLLRQVTASLTARLDDPATA